MRTVEVAAWINEREAIRLRKEVLETGIFPLRSGEGDGWLPEWWEPKSGWAGWALNHLTEDEILRRFRFCNVRREHDRVTRWIDDHIRKPYADHEHLWLMLAIARTINWPDTLEELMMSDGAFPSNIREFNPKILAAALQRRKDRREKVYTGAYIIRAPSSPSEPFYGWSKQRYIAEIVIGKLWENRYDLQHLNGPGVDTSQGIWEWFQMFTGWGPFMAYQVIVDLQHTRYLRSAPDVQTWAAAGPGTLRGLNRWLGRDPKAPTNQAVALHWLRILKSFLDSGEYTAPWVALPLDLSDVCNICCEFDKYERVRLGEGRPRALYVPGRGS